MGEKKSTKSSVHFLKAKHGLKCQFKVTGSPSYFLLHGPLVVFSQKKISGKSGDGKELSFMAQACKS